MQHHSFKVKTGRPTIVFRAHTNGKIIKHSKEMITISSQAAAPPGVGEEV